METKHTPGPSEIIYKLGMPTYHQLYTQHADILDALKSIIDWQDCPMTRPEAKELLIRNAARAAIARAEGRE
jgi:hypothetical protein